MGPSCENRYHALQLTSGSEAKMLTPGGSTSLGDLSITLGPFYDVVDHGSCDGGGRFAMGGFRIP
jgi:hypothetical protein